MLSQLASNLSPVSSGLSISVANVSKTYRIYRREDIPSSAAEAVIKKVKEGKQKKVREEFDALHDVSFEVGWGEVVGIIGRNGAGKSTTLLKIINRITAPVHPAASSSVAGCGQPAWRWAPDSTPSSPVGRTFYLNGTLLGMRRKEIRERFDAIVDFAGTEKFLDTQVKRYSTGMYIRLAFAVAAHLESEILVVDEVLGRG